KTLTALPWMDRYSSAVPRRARWRRYVSHTTAPTIGRTSLGSMMGGNPCPAAACLIEDSGERACYLVTGGAWGLRLKRTSVATAWSLANGEQWGESLLLVGGDGADLRFLDERR